MSALSISKSERYGIAINKLPAHFQYFGIILKHHGNAPHQLHSKEEKEKKKLILEIYASMITCTSSSLPSTVT